MTSVIGPNWYLPLSWLQLYTILLNIFCCSYKNLFCKFENGSQPINFESLKSSQNIWSLLGYFFKTAYLCKISCWLVLGNFGKMTNFYSKDVTLIIGTFSLVSVKQEYLPSFVIEEKSKQDFNTVTFSFLTDTVVFCFQACVPNICSKM